MSRRRAQFKFDFFYEKFLFSFFFSFFESLAGNWKWLTINNNQWAKKWMPGVVDNMREELLSRVKCFGLRQHCWWPFIAIIENVITKSH